MFSKDCAPICNSRNPCFSFISYILRQQQSLLVDQGLDPLSTSMSDKRNFNLGSQVLKAVKYWAREVMNRFDLGGFLILKSSEGCYHVVFNRRVLWRENMSIVAWTSLYSDSESMRKWFLMQCIKEASTLRVSLKGCKSSPRIIYREGKQEGQIVEFLEWRELIKNILRKLS